MITGVDHVVIGVRDLDVGVAAYECLLGRSASLRYERDGASVAVIPTANAAVELMAPYGGGEIARRLRTALDRDGEGWMSLVFAVSDIERMYRRATRVGLTPDAISEGVADALRWRRFRADAQATLGLRIFFIERTAPLTALESADQTALDHAVVRAGDMERAAALFGARLGLDMRLDRVVGDRRLMFFRGGDLIIEVAEDRAGGNRLWGLSWRVRDADAARARLADAGLDVSAVRDGMKPSTRVFTIRNKTCGVPTLMIETITRRD